MKNAFGDMSESVLLFLMAVTCEQFGVFYLITPTILTFPIAWIVSCLNINIHKRHIVLSVFLFVLPCYSDVSGANSSPSYSELS